MDKLQKEPKEEEKASKYYKEPVLVEQKSAPLENHDEFFDTANKSDNNKKHILRKGKSLHNF